MHLPVSIEQWSREQVGQGVCLVSFILQAGAILIPGAGGGAKPSHLLLQGGWTSKDASFHSPLPLSLCNPHTDDHPSIMHNQTDGGPFPQGHKTTWHFLQIHSAREAAVSAFL